MPLSYAYTAIPDHVVPVAAEPLLQPALDTYASETNKVASVWREFRDEDLVFRPHERASTVGDILKHQLLSERRFFGEPMHLRIRYGAKSDAEKFVEGASFRRQSRISRATR